MNKLFTFLLVSLPILLISQKQGTIVYMESTKLNIELPEEMKDMMANMPTERTAEKELIFTTGESLYKNSDRKDANEDTEMEGGSGGMHFKFKMSEPDNKTYTNLADKSYTSRRDLMGKMFLIEDILKKYDWKIGKEKRQILDFVCMNASAQVDDETSVMAWFTTSIPVSTGPGEYNGLPGAILAIEINENEKIIVAKEVILEEVEAGVIEKPRKGKKVNQEEFDRIREEKMKEMGAQSGGRGVRVITRTRSGGSN